MNIQCPCENCVCNAICRHKSYFEIAECPLLKPIYGDLVHDFGESGKDAAHKLQKEAIAKSLNPTQWSVNDNGWIEHGVWWDG